MLPASKLIFRLCFFILIYSGISISSHAQVNYDSILHKSYPERFQHIRDMHDWMLRQDITTLKKLVSEFKEFARKNNDEELVKEGMLIEAIIVQKTNGYKKTIDAFQDLIQYFIEKGDPFFESRTRIELSLYYWFIAGNFELAFDQNMQIYEIDKNLKYRDFPDKIMHYYKIGEAYYFFKDYTETIHYFTEALNEVKGEKKVRYHNMIRNTLGLTYQKLGKLDSSDYWFREILKDSSDFEVDAWRGIASGNLGYNLYLRKNYAEAVPLLEADIKAAEKLHDWELATGSIIPLADIKLKQGNLNLAIQLAERARKYTNMIRTIRSYNHRSKLYPLLSKIELQKGNPAASSMYMDSAFIVKDSLSERFNSLQLLRVKQKAELQKHQSEMAAIQSDMSINILKRNTLIAVLGLLMTIGFLYFKNKRQQHFHNELRLKSQLEKTEHELEIAGLQLSDFSRNISEKTNLLEALQLQVQNSSIKENNELLEELQKSTILTGTQWEQFRDLFNKVHPGFLNRLNEKIPGLSPAETRFMVLAKLKYNNKEMGAALGISPESLRVTSHRIRKKLGLPSDGSIHDLTDNI